MKLLLVKTKTALIMIAIAYNIIHEQALAFPRVSSNDFLLSAEEEHLFQDKTITTPFSMLKWMVGNQQYSILPHLVRTAASYISYSPCQVTLPNVSHPLNENFELADIISAINESCIIFIKSGQYVINKTITLKPFQRIYGIAELAEPQQDIYSVRPTVFDFNVFEDNSLEELAPLYYLVISKMLNTHSLISSELVMTPVIVAGEMLSSPHLLRMAEGSEVKNLSLDMQNLVIASGYDCHMPIITGTKSIKVDSLTIINGAPCFSGNFPGESPEPKSYMYGRQKSGSYSFSGGSSKGGASKRGSRPAERQEDERWSGDRPNRDGRKPPGRGDENSDTDFVLPDEVDLIQSIINFLSSYDFDNSLLLLAQWLENTPTAGSVFVQQISTILNVEVGEHYTPVNLVESLDANHLNSLNTSGNIQQLVTNTFNLINNDETLRSLTLHLADQHGASFTHISRPPRNILSRSVSQKSKRESLLYQHSQERIASRRRDIDRPETSMSSYTRNRQRPRTSVSMYSTRTTGPLSNRKATLMSLISRIYDASNPNKALSSIVRQVPGTHNPPSDNLIEITQDVYPFLRELLSEEGDEFIAGLLPPESHSPESSQVDLDSEEFSFSQHAQNNYSPGFHDDDEYFASGGWDRAARPVSIMSPGSIPIIQRGESDGRSLVSSYGRSINVKSRSGSTIVGRGFGAPPTSHLGAAPSSLHQPIPFEGGDGAASAHSALPHSNAPEGNALEIINKVGMLNFRRFKVSHDLAFQLPIKLRITTWFLYDKRRQALSDQLQLVIGSMKNDSRYLKLHYAVMASLKTAEGWDELVRLMHRYVNNQSAMKQFVFNLQTAAYSNIHILDSQRYFATVPESSNMHNLLFWVINNALHHSGLEQDAGQQHLTMVIALTVGSDNVKAFADELKKSLNR